MGGMNEEYIEEARKFKMVIEVVERFQYFILRRTIGILYLLIAATISVFLMIGLSISELFEGAYGLLVLTALFFAMLAIIFVVANNIFKLPRLYVSDKEALKDGGKERGIFWLILSMINFALMFVIIYTHAPFYLLPMSIQLFVALGNLGNYYFASKEEGYPGRVDREYLYLSLILFISTPLFPVFPGYGWFILTVFALAGTYITGLVILVTAEKALEEAQG